MGGVGHPAVGPDGLGHARKRNVTMAGLDSSPGSVDDMEDSELRDEKKRQQPVKRACNECRQQKVRTSWFRPPHWFFFFILPLYPSCLKAVVYFCFVS